MKSHYDHTVTMKEAVRIGEAAAKYNFQQAIDKYNREELPKIQASYAKMFILVLAGEFGFGEKRIRRAMRALGELTCEVHGMIKDGVLTTSTTAGSNRAVSGMLILPSQTESVGRSVIRNTTSLFRKMR